MQYPDHSHRLIITAFLLGGWDFDCLVLGSFWPEPYSAAAFGILLAVVCAKGKLALRAAKRGLGLRAYVTPTSSGSCATNEAVAKAGRPGWVTMPVTASREISS